MAENKVSYAARVTIDYPGRQLNRLTSFFRIFTVIPIAIVLGLLSSNGFSWGQHHNWPRERRVVFVLSFYPRC
jgi:hypothetical protein